MFKCEVLKRLDAIEQRLDEIVSFLTTARNMEMKMSQEIDALREQVKENTDVGQSAITLLTGLKQRLDAAISTGDLEAVKALSAEIGKNTTALSDAVKSNTPVDATTNPPTPTTP